MISREAEKLARRFLTQYPILTLMGPRQSGKTTLARLLFPKKPYVNLEDPDHRRFALQDPRGFLGQFPGGAILDEIQRTPDIPSYLQGIVDESGKNGLFILTGSQQFEISQTISQSLAGRTALLKLLPLTLGELESYKTNIPLDRVLCEGFYPRLHNQKIKPQAFFAHYFETYVQRDLRQLSQIDNLSLFEKFVRLMAGRVGSLLNHNQLSADLGVSQPTIKKWTSLLEASFILFLLPPFFGNLGKRLLKTPKVYFYDVGLASYLLGIEEKKHMNTHPLRGALFENLVVMEFLKNRFNQGLRSNLYFYRDSSGLEVDLLQESGNTIIPVEIKSGATPHPDFAKGILHLKKILPRMEKPRVIYGGNSAMRLNEVTFSPWAECVSKKSLPIKPKKTPK